ncbi:MAG: CAP domain-containing protein [Acidimicrobiales bacterium]
MASMVLSACNTTPAEDTNTAAINAVRAAVGLPELTRVPELDAKAKAQADRMAKKGTIFHSSNLASGVTEGWAQIGENVALAGSVEDAQRALEASPGHYENMVNPAFNQVGIGITVRNGITYVVQVFVSR